MQPRRVAWLLAVVPLLVALRHGAGAGHPPQAPDDFPSEVAAVWFDRLYDLVTTERITAPPASRIYGPAAVTLYEAVVPGSREHRSLVGQLHALAAVPQPTPHQPYHWPAVANTALAAASRPSPRRFRPACRRLSTRARWRRGRRWWPGPRPPASQRSTTAPTPRP